jgi:hypothetical protein
MERYSGPYWMFCVHVVVWRKGSFWPSDVWVASVEAWVCGADTLGVRIH